MYDLSDLYGNREDQDAGAWFEALDPIAGKPTGLRFLIAGPDSTVQAKARLALIDDLADASDDDGRVNAEAREKARLNQLARVILAWEAYEDGQPLACTHVNKLRLLRAGQWLQAQIDNRAASRLPFPIVQGDHAAD
ncbi:MAG: hypothetical protein WCO04_04310 [Pseudomonadota bacterium]